MNDGGTAVEQDEDVRRAPVWTRPTFVVAGSALAAMILVVVVWQFVVAGCGGLFSGLTSTDTGECVGVLHGDDLVDDSDLGRLIGRFDSANGAVAASTDAYVKIVLLTPLSVPFDGAPAAIPREQILSSLQGAFTAMSRANETAAFGSPNAPRIQIVLANQGSRQDDSPGLAQKIVDEGEQDHPVVAVVGLGSSLPGTAGIARDLAQLGIPMVSAVASADGLSAADPALRGLRSVSPSNTQYVRALRDFLDTQTVLDSGVIVADQNDDIYTSSLRDAFTRELKRYVRVSDPLYFNGSTVDSPATAQVFGAVIPNLCNTVDSQDRVNTVFYADRVTDFRSFVNALDTRTCKKNRPLAVLVGATGFDAARDYQAEIEKANLTVIYATSADPTSWTPRPGVPDPRGAPDGFGDFLDRFHGDGFADESLGDGYAIMYHDAVAAAASAVRLAALGRPAPPAADVNTQLSNIARASVLRGASGTLSFPADGRAVGKLVPLRQIGRTPTTSVLLPSNGCVYVVGGPCIPS